VQEWLGHARLSTTLDTYVQSVPNVLKHARKVSKRRPG